VLCMVGQCARNLIKGREAAVKDVGYGIQIILLGVGREGEAKGGMLGVVPSGTSDGSSVGGQGAERDMGGL
jgi:hypothetical protein